MNDFMQRKCLFTHRKFVEFAGLLWPGYYIYLNQFPFCLKSSWLQVRNWCVSTMLNNDFPVVILILNIPIQYYLIIAVYRNFVPYDRTQIKQKMKTISWVNIKVHQNEQSRPAEYVNLNMLAFLLLTFSDVYCKILSLP